VRTWTIGFLMAAVVFVLFLFAGAAMAEATASHGQGNSVVMPSPERP